MLHFLVSRVGEHNIKRARKVKRIREVKEVERKKKMRRIKEIIGEIN